MTGYLTDLFKHASGQQLEFLKNRYLTADKKSVKGYLWGVAKQSLNTGGLDVNSLFSGHWENIDFDRDKVMKIYKKRSKK